MVARALMTGRLRRVSGTYGVALALVGLALGAEPARSQDEPEAGGKPAGQRIDFTGNGIGTLCSSEDRFHQGICHGYFRGLSDTHSIFVAMRQNLNLYCLPEGVTFNQLERISFKWMGENPERLHSPASVLIVQALHEAFPCSEDGKPLVGTPSEPSSPGEEQPSN